MQIDNVGRSLRTQLPRFGYLNELHPAEHVRAITRVHDRPTVMDNFLGTFLAPLIAHRHYDSVPDVMIYDLRKPAKFPSGRVLTDDVGATLAEAGETLLLELSYAESKQFPRATVNDKPFRAEFPYLALRWTKAQIEAAAQPGATLENFAVPRAADGAAIAAPNLANPTWRTLWRLEVLAIAALTILLILTVRTRLARWALIVLALAAICPLQFVHADNLLPAAPGGMAQPALKLRRLVGGGVLIGALALGWAYALGRRSSPHPREPEPFPAGNQEVTAHDLPTATDSYDAIKNAVFAEPYYGNAWGSPDRRALPVYRQTVGSLLRGLIPIGSRLFLQAAQRTVRSRADLRWGDDRQGFRRLLHPMGICLTGTWKITAAPADMHYTGDFVIHFHHPVWRGDCNDPATIARPDLRT